MLRVRSTRLLSGASAIAILTGLAASGTANADPSYTGPFITPPIINDQPATVTITTFATIDRNGGTNDSNTAADSDFDSFFNGKDMNAAGNNLLIQDSYLLGDIENTASMTSSGSNSIFIGKNSQIGGRFFNSGHINGAVNGVVLTEASTITTGFFNVGRIDAGTGDAFNINLASEILGGLLNTGVMSGGNDGIGVNDANVDFFGGINNSGTIEALGTSAGAAVNWNGHSFTGGILNTGTIQGLGQSDGIRITAGTFAGGLDNQGELTGTGSGRAAFFMSGGTFSDELVNSGVMSGNSSAYGIAITGGTFSGAITNTSSGTIQVNSFLADAIRISAGTVSGGINNSGLIDASAGFNGINITGGTFSGGIANNTGARILASSTAILVSGGSFAGGITNSGLMQTFGTVGDAIHLGAVTFTGSILNEGTMLVVEDGIELVDTTFSQNIVNTGSIVSATSVGDSAIVIGGTSTVAGSVTNSGLLSASGNGINVGALASVTGDIVNDTGGSISAAGVGILVAGTVNHIYNNGVIDPAFGIQVTGTVSNGIFNTDSIIGTTAGIDLATETGTTYVEQTAGLLRGNSVEDGTGTVGDALRMNNAHANLFRMNGGVLDGNVVANNTDDMHMVPLEDTAVWLRGTGSNIDDFNTGGERGTQILGAAARGTNGVGVTVGANQMLVDTGRTYLDDNTAITLVNGYTATITDAITEFYLTSDVLTHAVITAGGAVDTTADNIAAFVDGSTFGSIGGNTFDYIGVMQGASTTGVDGAIETNSLFFEGKAFFNVAPGRVDIRLTRLDFADALVLPGMTNNEAAIAGALDDIYGLGTGIGGYGPDFEDLFNYLLSLPAGSEALVLAIYNELAGAEHAQLQQTSLDILNPFNTFMGQRLDGAHAGQIGLGMASLRQPQYAQAAAVMSDASPGLARGDSGVSLWARGYGQTLSLDGDAEAPGYDQNSGGAVGGVDFALGKDGVLGFAVGWSNTNVDFNTPGDSADVDAFQVGAYGSYSFGRLYLDVEAAGAFNNLETTRLLNLPNPPGGFVAGADYDARALSAAGELGGVWRSGNWIFQPNAGVLFTDVDTESFIESGGGDFSLIVGGADSQSLASSVGFRTGGQFKSGNTTLLPMIGVAWRHEFDDDRTSFTAAFPDDPTSTFNIISSKIDPDSALVEAGVTAAVSRNFEIYINYNGLVNKDVDVHNGSAGFRATW